jgi:hypothetical protein
MKLFKGGQAVSFGGLLLLAKPVRTDIISLFLKECDRELRITM